PPPIAAAPLFLYSAGHHRPLPSFPTRRSSDLDDYPQDDKTRSATANVFASTSDSYGAIGRSDSACSLTSPVRRTMRRGPRQASRDRKSTRLNSSHDQISYAVFCLKKKKQHQNT